MITREVLSSGHVPDPGLLQQAEAAIASFEASFAPSAWNFLDKATIIRDIRARVQDPFQVNQGGQPFCGPAAVLFELVRKHPQRYAEICWTLFTTGGFQAKSQYIGSSENLRQKSYGDLQMPQADWMVLATLRDVETQLFPVEPNSPDLIRNLAGMTKSWEMKGWVREILGYRTVNYNHAYLMNDISALNDATQVIQSGGVAFALITAEAMLGDKAPLVPFPSHWIALLGEISVEGDRVSFEIYTWSKRMRLRMDERSFKKYFWATVTGLP